MCQLKRKFCERVFSLCTKLANVLAHFLEKSLLLPPSIETLPFINIDIFSRFLSR